MRYYILFIIYLLVYSISASSYANSTDTTRIPYFSNDQVKVWKTTIYPSKNQALKMHRHENNRVLVALDSGVLKIVNNHSQVHYLKLEKDKAYYLTKDVIGETHTDENVSHHPIKVVVIELID